MPFSADQIAAIRARKPDITESELSAMARDYEDFSARRRTTSESDQNAQGLIHLGGRGAGMAGGYMLGGPIGASIGGELGDKVATVPATQFQAGADAGNNPFKGGNAAVSASWKKYGPAGIALAYPMGMAGSVFGHTSTKQRQAKMWQDLLAEGISSARKGTDTDRFAGFHGGQSYDQVIRNEGAKGVYDSDVRDSYALVKAFGDDWYDKLNESQRNMIARRAIESGLLSSNHGDVISTDYEALRALGDDLLPQTTTPEPESPLIANLHNLPGKNLPSPGDEEL